LPSKKKKSSAVDPAETQTWRAAEALGHAHYLNRGGRVLISPYDISQYDFVVDMGDSFFRVNVKVGTWAGRSYIISRSRPNSKDPDRYLVWLPRHTRFVELPGDFLSESKSRRIPLALTQ
jgi:hypothetical protein